MAFQKVLEKYRKISFSERDKGDRFERLMQAYIQTDPTYANKFKAVWLWNEFPSNDVDAVVGYFESRGFDRTASISTATVILQQAKIDGVKVFELLDTLKGMDKVQLSYIVTEIANLPTD